MLFLSSACLAVTIWYSVRVEPLDNASALSFVAMINLGVAGALSIVLVVEVVMDVLALLFCADNTQEDIGLRDETKGALCPALMCWTMGGLNLVVSLLHSSPLGLMWVGWWHVLALRCVFLGGAQVWWCGTRLPMPTDSKVNSIDDVQSQ
jgi:hypothetical protein